MPSSLRPARDTHAVVAPEGPAQDRRALPSRQRHGGAEGGRRHARRRWSSGRTATTSAPKRARRCPTLRFSCRASGSARRMRCWRRARRWSAAPTTSWSSSATRRWSSRRRWSNCGRRSRTAPASWCSASKARRSDRLRSPADGWQRRACRHPRARGRVRGGARDDALQRRRLMAFRGKLRWRSSTGSATAMPRANTT